MSDTRRYTQPGWDAPWCKSKKHQQRDRDDRVDHKFMKGVRNIKYNLQEKIYELMKKEHLEG